MRDWNWQERIAAMMTVRDELYNADKDGLWEYYLPEPAADISDIDDVQQKLEVAFSGDYIDFLLCADGWKCFFQLVDLFGTKDYGTEAFGCALMRLREEIESDPALYKAEEPLFPIAVSRTDMDLFVMVLKGENQGQIIWLAGGEIERFDTFCDFFEEMIDYNRSELEDMLNDEQFDPED